MTGVAFRIFAGVLFALAVGFGFGWVLPTDTARAIGCVGAGLLMLVLSTVPIVPDGPGTRP